MDPVSTYEPRISPRTPYLAVDPVFTYEPRISTRTPYLAADPVLGLDAVFSFGPMLKPRWISYSVPIPIAYLAAVDSVFRRGGSLI